MNCPNCGSKIQENQKFCTNCGFDLSVKESNSNNMHGTLKNNYVVIISLIFLFIISLGIVFIGYSKFKENSEKDLQIELPSYKKQENVTIEPMWSEIDDLTAKQAIDKLIQQEKDLKDFLLNHSKDENSEVFAIFYRNILCVSENLDKKLNNGSFSTEDINLIDDKLKKVGLIKKVLNKGYDNIEPDYNYRYNTYSTNLDKAFDFYLKFKKQDQIKRDGYSLWLDGQRNGLITRAVLIDYLLSLRKFLNNNPEFELWEDVLSDIKIYTDAFIFIGNYDKETSEQILNFYKQFLSRATKDTFEYETLKDFYDIYANDNKYLEEYNDKYKKWYEMKFYDDGVPRITQFDINVHNGIVSKIAEEKFQEKTNEIKNTKLQDNHEFLKYIDNYEQRKKEIELIVFPNKNTDPMEYGSSFPIQLSNLEEQINDMTFFTYQKIIDTYNNNYEHVNMLRKQKYQEYYDKVVSNILNSEYFSYYIFSDYMRKYIDKYDIRKNILKQTVFKQMKEIDFDVWFNKIELYSYKCLLMGAPGFEDKSEEIDKIFEE